MHDLKKKVIITDDVEFGFTDALPMHISSVWITVGKRSISICAGFVVGDIRNTHLGGGVCFYFGALFKEKTLFIRQRLIVCFLNKSSPSEHCVPRFMSIHV